MKFDDVRALALAWPGVEDGTSYGTPALKVKGKFLTRLREDGDTLVVLEVPVEERELLIEAEPEIFYVTDHYRDYPAMLVRLSAATPDVVERLLLRRFRAIAPKRLLREWEARAVGDGTADRPPA